MSILRLKPSGKSYIWGGTRLMSEYKIESNESKLAEAWMLSTHPDGPCTIQGGNYDGKTLSQYITESGMGVLGVNCKCFEDFPILIKLIDAKDNLSIQVHPDNVYAKEHEGQYGKTEMWYIVDCTEDACLYYGMKEEIKKEEFLQRVKEDRILEVLHKVLVKRGDVFFIEAGMIHAIGENILIAEIQQNSNVTYRVYDYGRLGGDGKARELHVEKAAMVSRLYPQERIPSHVPHVAFCPYFTVDKLYLDGHYMHTMSGVVNEYSFLSILVLNGEGTIQNAAQEEQYKKGDSFFLPASSKGFVINGCGEFLLTYIGYPQKEDVKVGLK